MHISNSPHTAYANGVAQSYGAAGRSYQSVNPDRNGNFTNGCYPAQTHHAVNGVNGISAVNGVAYPRPDASMSTGKYGRVFDVITAQQPVWSQSN